MCEVPKFVLFVSLSISLERSIRLMIHLPEQNYIITIFYSQENGTEGKMKS
ncbi:uncharacterized protein METZ01_LOCUS461548 [marine metagenome]|uniref:Uncharacterized protein n=1 Tax=marine metagenome TaxID=408172 RepID=A0A383ALZ2_9ZZZZ